TILMVQDITDQKQAEAVLLKSRDELEREVQLRTAQLRRAQRMETIGTLAGGIAHDFNNSLAVILGFSKAALMDLPEDSPIREDLNEVLLAANRGKDMVRQILMLARKENRSDHVQVNMASLLAETINQLQVNTPGSVRVHVDIQLESPFVSGASTQLSQVITNLYTNACHAMAAQSDGVMKVTLKNELLPERTVRGGVLVGPGAYVVLTLTDNGCGISQTDLPHVFDPFFTTRARDEGTGLGLASAQVIIHNHDGEIGMESQVGEGTVFYIYLPVPRQPPTRESVSPDRVSDYGPPAAGETILWVDDKRQILKMGQRLLTPFGYQVSIANGGEEALRIFDETPDGFCLVITDYSMPGMTGIELANELRRRQPDIPIIMMSGYDESISKEALAASGINAFLKKPVEAKDLVKSIKKVMHPLVTSIL
ncbi:MAG: response regulator, partial [Deltaproteobacteria bacterium]|nr:response regulator [Deltaproteobacteria bacterium]